MGKKDSISQLRLSSQRVGRFYPVLLDRQGNIIDGQHRIAADANWPKIRLEHVETEREVLLARLIINVCRRNVSATEKRDLLTKLGEIHLTEGVRRGKIANKIADETGMSYRWVMKYLPGNLKEKPGVGGPSKVLEFEKCQVKKQESEVARLATGEENVLLSDPPERIATVKNFANTRFVGIVLERQFYIRFEKMAKKLGTPLDVIISNALLSALKQLEGM